MLVNRIMGVYLATTLMVRATSILRYFTRGRVAIRIFYTGSNYSPGGVWIAGLNALLAENWGLEWHQPARKSRRHFTNFELVVNQKSEEVQGLEFTEAGSFGRRN